MTNKALKIPLIHPCKSIYTAIVYNDLCIFMCEGVKNSHLCCAVLWSCEQTLCQKDCRSGEVEEEKLQAARQGSSRLQSAAIQVAWTNGS